MADIGTYGFLAGIGRAQQYYNEQEYQNQLEGEKSANEGTVKILETLLNRPDVDESTKNAALGSLLQFSQVKGRPTSKHRQAAMEPVLRSMSAPRPGPGAMQLEQTAQQTESQPFTPNTPGAGGTYTTPTGGQEPLEQVNPAIDAQSIRRVESMVPQRTGFMRPDEIGARYAAETSAMMGGSGGGGRGMGGDGGMTMVPRFTMGRGGATMGLTARVLQPTQADYTLDDGSSGIGFYVPSVAGGGRIYDRNNQDITSRVTRLEPRGGMMETDTVADANGQPVRQKFNRVSGQSGTVLGRVPVRSEFFTGYDDNGNIMKTAVNPYTSAGTVTPIGKVPFASDKQMAIRLGNESKSLAVRGKYTDGSVPAWQPTTTDAQGNVVPVPQKNASYVINAGNSRKAQAAVQTVDMIDFLRQHMGNIEQKFGTFRGTVEELVSKYVDDPDVRAIAPIIKEHLPSAISGMYGFRAYQSKLDYGEAVSGAFRTFLGQPLTNVQAALDSTYEIAKRARDEAFNPQFQNSGAGTRPPKPTVPPRSNMIETEIGPDGKIHVKR